MTGQRRHSQISENESRLYQQTCPKSTAEGTSRNKVMAEGTLEHPGGKGMKSKDTSNCDERPSSELSKVCWTVEATL